MVMFDNIEDIFQEWRSYGVYSKSLVTLATAIGTLIILIYFIKLIYYIYNVFRLYFLNQLCCHVNYRERYGQWAVISGATDGIGLAMAKELAKRGHSLIIIGRNEEKLANTKAMLEEEVNVGEVLTVKIDLSDSSISNYERIMAEIDPFNRQIGILINNAGTFSARLKRLGSADIDFLRSIVNINVLATVYLTRLILPGMLERQKGLIVNVSSLIGSMEMPYSSTYSCTKAFVDTFSRDLQMEYSSHPIDIINLAPGPVHTKLFIRSSGMEQPTFMSPSADSYAKTSINAFASRKHYISGNILHSLMLTGTSIVRCLGLTQCMFKLMMFLRPSYFSLSPVARRKASDQIPAPENS